jgi:hypothetical protein
VRTVSSNIHVVSEFRFIGLLKSALRWFLLAALPFSVSVVQFETFTRFADIIFERHIFVG